mgnify:CR=1 FL=1
MSQSIYLYVYFRGVKDKNNFKDNIIQAKIIFKKIWTKEGTGFCKQGNIKYLEEMYRNNDWGHDADLLKEEKGELKILSLHPPDRDENFSFNFHNYGGETVLNKDHDLRDIYLLFAEILSALGYLTLLKEEYDDIKYSCVFWDGKKYDLNPNVNSRDEEINNLLNYEDAKKSFEIAERRLKELEEWKAGEERQ